LKSSICLQAFLPFLLIFMIIPRVAAQDSDSIPVRFAGRIQSVANGTLIIDQIRVDTTNASANAILQPDNIVIIDGILRADGTIVARAILTYIPVNPTSVAPAQSPPSSSVVIEGIVQRIDKDTVTVNDQKIQFAHHDPLLSTVQIGDRLRIEGNYTQTPKGLVFQSTQATITSRAQENASTSADNGNNGNSKGMGKGMGG